LIEESIKSKSIFIALNMIESHADNL